MNPLTNHTVLFITHFTFIFFFNVHSTILYFYRIQPSLSFTPFLYYVGFFYLSLSKIIQLLWCGPCYVSYTLWRLFLLVDPLTFIKSLFVILTNTQTFLT